MYLKLSKRNALLTELEEEIVTIESKKQTDFNQNQTRRSKRRKTEKQLNDENKLDDVDFRKEAKMSTRDERLWTEKYQFTDEFDIVYNKSQLERLAEWLEQFKRIKTVKKKKVKKAKTEDLYSNSDDDEGDSNNCKTNDDDSDFDYDSDCSTSTTSSSCSTTTSKKDKFFKNAILLNGPFGSGKTSSVYCVANKLNFKLFECNSSSLRSKTQIIQELLGVLSSHHVGLNKKLSRRLFNEQEKLKNPEYSSKNQVTSLKKGKKTIAVGDNKSIDTFFKKKSQVLTNSTNDNTCLSRKRRKSISQAVNVVVEDDKKIETREETSGSEVQVLKDSLILFDDIDVVLKDDIGFWSVITFFIKNSKKPIILTCNDERMLKKIELNIEEIKFNKPSKELCINYLKTILLCESKRCLNEEFYLNKLITDNKCDIRHSLLQLQMNTCVQRNEKVLNKKVSEKENLSPIDFYGDYTTTDYLNKQLDKLTNKYTALSSAELLKHDYFIYKEGLIDDTALIAGEITQYQHEDDKTNSFDSFRRREFITELLNLLSKNCINEDYNLEFYVPNGNKPLFKFASSHYRFTSTKSLYMDYAPCLRAICKVEHLKQESNSKRRFLHYLNTTSNSGLTKEDYLVLAKDHKFEYMNEIKKETTTTTECYVDRLSVNTCDKDLYEN